MSDTPEVTSDATRRRSARSSPPSIKSLIEHEDCVARPVDQLLAVGERRLMSVPPPSCVAEQHINRIGELVGQVDDRRVEHDEAASVTSAVTPALRAKTLE